MKCKNFESSFSIAKNQMYNQEEIIFDFSEKTISNEFNFLALVDGIEDDSFEANKIKKVFHGEDTDVKITLDFTNTIFEVYPLFDGIHCHTILFKNTTFLHGARLRDITVENIKYEPNKIESDVTFGNMNKIKIDDFESYSLKPSGSIKKFKYRHQHLGSGKTFFIAPNFTESGDFTSANLDNVIFINTNMKNIYFLDSKLDKARFQSCKFPQIENDIRVYGIEYYLMILIGSLFLGFVAHPLFFILSFFAFIPIFIKYIHGTFIKMISFLDKTFFGNIFNVGVHLGVADEKELQSSDSQNEAVRYTLRNCYCDIKNNLKAGDDEVSSLQFYYSQKLIELSQGYKFHSVIEKIIDFLRYGLNGFSMKPFRAVVWMIVIIFVTYSLIEPEHIVISQDKNMTKFIIAEDLNSSDEKKVFYYVVANTLPTLIKSDAKDYLKTDDLDLINLISVYQLLMIFLFGAFGLALNNSLKK